MSFIHFVKGQIATIRQKDPSLKSNIEILFYPGFRALNAWYFSHKLYLKKHYALARVISLRAQSKTGIDIHPGARIGKHLLIDHGVGVVIGETCVIGDDVTIYQGVTLGANGKSTGQRHPIVEDGVVIGAGAKVIGNIVIGKYSKIGAGAIVIKNVEPYTTMVSVPAHAVRIRDQKVPVLTVMGLDDKFEAQITQLKLDESRLRERMDEMEARSSSCLYH